MTFILSMIISAYDMTAQMTYVRSLMFVDMRDGIPFYDVVNDPFLETEDWRQSFHGLHALHPPTNIFPL